MHVEVSAADAVWAAQTVLRESETAAVIANRVKKSSEGALMQLRLPGLSFGLEVAMREGQKGPEEDVCFVARDFHFCCQDRPVASGNVQDRGGGAAVHG